MNSLERVNTSINLKKPDKIPFHAYESVEHAIRQTGYKVHEMYLEPNLVPEAMINTAKKYANDIIYMRPAIHIPDEWDIRVCEDYLLIRNKKDGNELGRIIYDTKEFIPTEFHQPSGEDLNYVERIPIIPKEEILSKPETQSMKRYVEEFKGKRFLFAFAAGQSANTLDSLLGTENAMISTITDPGLCKAIMERKFEALKEEILAFKEVGADGIYTGDACASCSFYSPEIYRTLFFEYHKKSIDFIHTQGMKTLLHICGKISPILEDMVNTGADIIESLDRPCAGGDINLKDAKQRVGNRVCLKGNIDAVHEIAPGPPEKIYEICIEAMRDAGPEGYILSTEQITRDTPSEHVLAMVQARDDFASKI